MKTCTKCGVVKDYLDFYKDKTKKDGFSGACKAHHQLNELQEA